MKRNLLFTIALGALFLGGVVVWQRGASDRDIARLVQRIDQGENYLTNAELRKLLIGQTTQAVQHALILIHRKDPAWKKLAMELDRKVASINLDWDTESARGFKAGKIFFVTGPHASNFVPTFGQLLTTRKNAFYGQMALVFAGRSAIATVTNLFAHPDKRVRADAAVAYIKIESGGGFTTQFTEAGTGKTIYTPALTLGDNEVRGLGRMLTNNNSLARRAAAEALERHSGIGRAAVPALKEALADPETDVRTAAQAALNAIAPTASP